MSDQIDDFDDLLNAPLSTPSLPEAPSSSTSAACIFCKKSGVTMQTLLGRKVCGRCWNTIGVIAVKYTAYIMDQYLEDVDKAVKEMLEKIEGGQNGSSEA